MIKKIWIISAVLLLGLILVIASSALGARGGIKGPPSGTTEPAACNDHIDNDGDGFCDFSWKKAYCDDNSIVGDSNCTSKHSDFEGIVCTPTTEFCDGLDNDCDELVDEDNVCGGDTNSS